MMLTLVAQVGDVGSSIAVGGPLAIILATALVILWRKLEAKDAQLDTTKRLEAENAELRADVTELRKQVHDLKAENKADREKLTERLIGVFEGAGKATIR
jgi:hypothetical protein